MVIKTSTGLFLLQPDLKKHLARVGAVLHQLMGQSCLLQWERLGDPDTELARQKYQAIIDEFPKSSYADTARAELAGLK